MLLLSVSKEISGERNTSQDSEVCNIVKHSEFM